MATTITAGNATNGAAISSDNTGILELKTGTGAGTTAMTVDTSQNVGIGTASPASKLHVTGLARICDPAAYLLFRNAADTTSNGVIQFPDTGDASIVNYRNTGLTLGTNNNTRITIDNAGNVGIGTSSPATRLDVSGSMQVTGSISGYGGGEIRLGLTTSGNDNAISTRATGAAIMAFDHRGTSNTGFWLWRNGTDAANERMRLTSGGELLLGTTTIDAKLVVQNTSQSYDWALRLKTVMDAPGTNNYYFVDFRTSSDAQTGYIWSNGGTTTAYVTSSDYRLKENIAPITGALEKVSLLKPSTWTWKLNGQEGQGFIAHELQAICPDAVSGKKDEVETYVDEDGNEQTRPRYQGVDTSFLVATLTAAIQELKAELDATKAEVAALKGAA